MGRLSEEVKLCRGDCSVIVSSEKFASPFTLAVKQTCDSVGRLTSEKEITMNAFCSMMVVSDSCLRVGATEVYMLSSK